MSTVRSNRGEMLKAVVIGTLSAAIITAILMCILSLFFLISSSLPSSYLEYILLALEAVGTVLGAYIAARVMKRQGLVTGLSVAGIFLAAVLIAGFSSSTNSPGVMTLIRAVVLLLCGALAGIKGVNRKEKLHIK